MNSTQDPAARLAAKLGLHAGCRLLVLGAPEEYREDRLPLPAGILRVGDRADYLDCCLLFTRERGDLGDELPALAARLAPEGILWVAWPREAADLSMETLRQWGKGAGLRAGGTVELDERWRALEMKSRGDERPPAA